jgi:hypothetical protein
MSQKQHNVNVVFVSLSLFLYSFALLQLGRRGATNWGCWLPWCLQSSDGVHRCSKLLPVVEPKGFSPDPRVNHQLHSQSPHPSNFTTAREKGARKRRRTKNKRRCVCVCVWVSFSLATILLLGAETTVGGSSPFSYKMGFSRAGSVVMRKQLLLWLSDEARGCTAAVAAAMSIAKFSQLC